MNFFFNTNKMSYTNQFTMPSQPSSSYQTGMTDLPTFFKTYWMYIVGAVAAILLLVVVWYMYKRPRESFSDRFFD